MTVRIHPEYASIKRFKKLSTIEASKEFHRRTIALEKTAQTILDRERRKLNTNKFSSKSEQEFISVLGKWTSLWQDMAVYYSEFKPLSANELYQELYPKLFASISEASVVCQFIGYRFPSTDHLQAFRSNAGLKITLLGTSLEVKIPKEQLDDVRLLESFQLPDIDTKFHSGAEMSTYFRNKLSRFRSLNSSPGNPSFS